MTDADPPAGTPTGVPSTEPFTGPLAAVPPPEEADPPAADRYRPERLYRVGGMGRVFVAADGELNRKVALKDIRAKHRDAAWAVPRFVFEAEVTGELEHPGVVPVYGMGRCPRGRPYYAMRFVDGQTLTDAIRDFHATFAETGTPGSLSAAQTVQLRGLLGRFLAVCQTIAYAHSRGVIHRDLKPANVLLGPFGETLVVDWGLAKRLAGESRPAEAPTAGGVAGTTAGGSPPWWAPEQSQAAAGPHDERTDVYGLGAVLFHVLTGRPPHPTGRHPAEPPTAREQMPWVDGELDGIVRRSLSLDPADRPDSAKALSTAVEEWLADQPVAAQRATVARLGGQAAARPGDRVLEEQFARQTAALGHVYAGMGRGETAAAVLANAAAVFAELFAKHKVARYRADEANCLIDQAQVLYRIGRTEEADGLARQASAAYDGLMTTFPGEYRANYATILITRQTDGPSAAADDVSVSRPPDTAGDGPTAPADEPELVPGYTVLRVLGDGGSGRVLLALDNALQRPVAIKEFSREFVGSRARRFLREMQATARLTHPNIVTLYTYGVHTGTARPFLVMEYVEGRTLQDERRAFQAAGGRPARGDRRFVRLLTGLAQTADAIGHVHRSGLVHRDPKPANIILRPDGVAKLIDFGLVKLIGRESDPEPGDETEPVFDDTATRAGTVLGTPAFMAPEQALGEDTVGPASDIYVLGAGLFFLLTGTPPHGGGSMHDILSNMIRGRVPRPRDVRPDVPPELDAICVKATAYQPEARYPTADALAADLRAWLAGRPVSAYRYGFARRLWRRLADRPAAPAGRADG